MAPESSNPAVSRLRNWWQDLRLQSSRGDKTAIELFCQGVASWDASLQRRVDDGKSKPD
jgi:hypothetical protein